MQKQSFSGNTKTDIHHVTCRVVLSRSWTYKDVIDWLPSYSELPTLPFMKSVSKGVIHAKSQPEKHYEFFDITFEVTLMEPILPLHFNALLGMAKQNPKRPSKIARIVFSSDPCPSPTLGLTQTD
jgi:hypothetical protein